MSRRLFVRGLVALGVSVGAAATYADALSAKAPSAASPSAAADDYYPDDPGVSGTNDSSAAVGAAVAGNGVGTRQVEPGRVATPVRAEPDFTG